MSVRPLHVFLALLALPVIGSAAAPPRGGGAAGGGPPAPPPPPPWEQELEDAMKAGGDAQRGARAFAACAACHGTTGRGNAATAVPAIAGQHKHYIAKRLVDYRHLLQLDPRTSASAANHALPSASAIADMAAHVAALDRRGAAGRGDGRQVALGRTTYAANCASCHGKSGEGNADEAAPRLAGQHYQVLMRQLDDAAHGWRPRNTPDHMPLLNILTADERTGLADALSRMQ